MMGWLTLTGVVLLLGGTGCSSCGNTEPGGDTPLPDAGIGNTQGMDASMAGASSSGTPGSSAAGSSSTLMTSSGMAGSSGGMGATTVTITAPANDGTTVTGPLLINATVNFTADIFTAQAISAANIQWTLTAPDATLTQSGGTLSGSTAAFSALLAQAGNYTLRITYNDGTAPTPAAQLVVPVYSNLPPQLAWIAPENDGTSVTGARRVGGTLSMQATLTDDAALLPQAVAWTHTRPDATTVTSQGIYSAGGQGGASLSFLVDLATVGMHSVQVSYTDGTHTRSLLLAIQVAADLPPVTTYTSPSNDGSAVTVPVAVGDALSFQVTILDDTTILPQNSTFVVTSANGTQTPNQGMITAAGTSATASLSVTFNTEGAWSVAHHYTDGVTAPVATVLAIVVSMDPAPVVRITQPAHDGTTVTQDVRAGGAMAFAGTIQDNLAIAPQNVLWTFTAAGGAVQTSQGTISGAGNTVSSAFAVTDVGGAGQATIALRYTDAGGGMQTVQLNVPVRSATAPILSITAPALDGTQVRTDAVVAFVASVADDVAIVPTNLAWTLTSPGGGTLSSPGGFNAALGQSTFSAALTAPGTWTAAIRYVDASGQQAAASRTVSVVTNTAPTCSFVPVNACVPTGDLDVQVDLADADGDTPISATITSANAQDVVAPATVTGSGRRTVTVTLATAGTHTLRCVPTDAAGAVGATATLDVPVVGAPTMALSAPADRAIITSGSNVSVTLMGMSDAAAAPATVTLTDSIHGTQVVTAGGATVTAPSLGFHDLRAGIADACGGSDADTVRYVVTVGGAAAASLFPATNVTQPVLVAAVQDAAHVLVGTENVGVRNVDTSALTDAAYQPNAGGAGSNVPGNEPIRDIAMGAEDTMGARREAYATAVGVYACVNLAGTAGDTCAQVQNTQGVTDVLILGQGITTGALMVTGSSNGLRIYSATNQILDDVQEGGNQDEILGEVRDIVAADPSSTSLNPVSFWVATDKGVARVTLSQQGQVSMIQHFDEDTTQDLLPDYNVRAIAVDPGNIESQWFATAGGLGHHQGPAYGTMTWTSYTRQSAGLASNDLTAVAVDRFPSAQVPIVWVGTGGAGAFRLDVSAALAPLVTTISAADGMPQGRVNSVIIHPQDAAHTKWFGTASGLFGYTGQ